MLRTWPFPGKFHRSEGCHDYVGKRDCNNTYGMPEYCWALDQVLLLWLNNAVMNTIQICYKFNTALDLTLATFYLLSNSFHLYFLSKGIHYYGRSP